MIEYFQRSYFIVLLQIALNIVFIIGCVLHMRQLRSLRIIFAYSLIALIQSLVGVYYNVTYTKESEMTRFLEKSIEIFIMLEFATFSIFIIRSLVLRIPRLSMIIVSILFGPVSVYALLTKGNYGMAPSYLTFTESAFIIFGCLLFYYEKFVLPIKLPINKQTAFYVISGMFFLFAFLTPLSIYLDGLYLEFVSTYHLANALNYVAYSILYIFFLIALKCRITLAP